MFSTAIQKAMKYTRPVIISKRFANGKIECGYGAYVILNQEGWMLTASHIMEGILRYQQDQKELADYETKKSQIEQDQSLQRKRRQKLLSKLVRNPNWIANISYYWGLQNSA